MQSLRMSRQTLYEWRHDPQFCAWVRQRLDQTSEQNWTLILRKHELLAIQGSVRSAEFILKARTLTPRPLLVGVTHELSARCADRRAQPSEYRAHSRPRRIRRCSRASDGIDVSCKVSRNDVFSERQAHCAAMPLFWITDPRFYLSPSLIYICRALIAAAAPWPLAPKRTHARSSAPNPRRLAATGVSGGSVSAQCASCRGERYQARAASCKVSSVSSSARVVSSSGIGFRLRQSITRLTGLPTSGSTEGPPRVVPLAEGPESGDDLFGRAGERSREREHSPASNQVVIGGLTTIDRAATRGRPSSRQCSPRNLA
jgi:hypothetical protein